MTRSGWETPGRSSALSWSDTGSIRWIDVGSGRGEITLIGCWTDLKAKPWDSIFWFGFFIILLPLLFLLLQPTSRGLETPVHHSHLLIINSEQGRPISKCCFVYILLSLHIHLSASLKYTDSHKVNSWFELELFAFFFTSCLFPNIEISRTESGLEIPCV